MIKNISKIIKQTPKIYFKNSRYNYSKISAKLLDHPYSRLCRYDKPIGCMLLYWPVTWGLAIGSPTLPALTMYAMFFMGAWTSRSAGCIINDYFDQHFDKKVQRCKDRPLASGEVSTVQAFGILFLNLCGGLYVLTQLPVPALIATFGILPIAALYPLAKRYTKYPQFVLGMAFNSGVIIGALTLNPDSLNWLPALMIYSSGICWTLVYDTVYAYQDIEDDKKLGLFSTAITWEKNPKRYLNIMVGSSFLFACSTAIIDPSFIYCVPGYVCSYGYLYFLLKRLNLSNRQQCGHFFRFLMLLSLLLRGVFKSQVELQHK